MPAPAAAPAPPAGDKRAKLRELLARGRENGGEGRGEMVKRLIEQRLGGGSAGGDAPGNGELLRRLKQRGGLGDAARGGADAESELAERLRRLEAELESLRATAVETGHDLAAGSLGRGRARD